MNCTFEIGSRFLLIYIFAREQTATKMTNRQTRIKLPSSYIIQNKIYGQWKKRVEYKENQHHVGKKMAWLKVAALLKSSQRENGLIQHVQPSQPALDRHLCSGLLDQLHSNETWTSGGKNSRLAWPADKQNHDANLHSRANVKIIEKRWENLELKSFCRLEKIAQVWIQSRASQQTLGGHSTSNKEEEGSECGATCLWNREAETSATGITKKLKKDHLELLFIIFICCDVDQNVSFSVWYLLIPLPWSLLWLHTHTHIKLMRR